MKVDDSQKKKVSVLLVHRRLPLKTNTDCDSFFIFFYFLTQLGTNLPFSHVTVFTKFRFQIWICFSSDEIFRVYSSVIDVANAQLITGLKI